MKKVKVINKEEPGVPLADTFTKILSPQVDLITLMTKYREINDQINIFWIRYQQLGKLLNSLPFYLVSAESMKSFSDYDWPDTWTPTLLVSPDVQKMMYDEITQKYERLINSYQYSVVSGFLAKNTHVLKSFYKSIDDPSGITKIEYSPQPDAADKAVGNTEFDKIFAIDPTLSPSGSKLRDIITQFNQISADAIFHKCSNTDKEKFMKLTTDIYWAAYMAVEAFFTPDIDGSKLKSYVSSALGNDTLSNNPRYRSVLKAVKKSLDCYDVSFPRYYRSYVISGNTSIILEMFVADIGKIISAMPEMTGENNARIFTEIESHLLNQVPSNFSNAQFAPFINMMRKSVNEKKAMFSAMDKLKDLHGA